MERRRSPQSSIVFWGALGSLALPIVVGTGTAMTRVFKVRFQMY
jgi:hypothetical protein